MWPISAVVASAEETVGASACELILETGVGYGANDTYFDIKHNTTIQDCCSWCTATPQCAAFTWHESAGVCTIAEQITLYPELGPKTTSGRKKNTPFPPPPPSNSCVASPPAMPAVADAPNIALVLCDDLDLELGGMTPLTKVRSLLGDGGATADKWFIHTPVCCPSRAQLLTGRYFHNLRVSEPSNVGCMHVEVQAPPKPSALYDHFYFAPHLQRAGYTVGIFGKHLNQKNPACPPPGVDRWFANGGGSYFSPQFAVASAGDDAPRQETWANCSYNGGACYSTSVIGNVSLAWMAETQAAAAPKPFFAYIAVKAPHIQDGPGWPVALPAPWHAQSFPPSVQAPRTETWNVTYADHHWLVRQQPPMTVEQAHRSDALYRARWQALLSVDDLVAGVVRTLDAASVAPNGRASYVIFTSDHGYQFGQFRMPQGKWNVYENDISIPFLIRGPGIAAGSVFSHIGSNVDTMPTILGFAGVATPPTMDGRSAAALLLSDLASVPSTARQHVLAERATARPWRTDLLVEYYGLGNVVRYQHLEDTYNNTFRALRVYDPARPEGQRNLKLVQFTGLDNWNFSAPVDEYGYEWELFDLDADRHETTNLYATTNATRRAVLFAKLQQLYACQGATCN